MLLPGQRVVAGVSGGADSVCLLFVLLEYRKKMPFELAVVHVDHGLREEAGSDAEFVRELCRREKVPFFLRKADVRGLAAREKRSHEEAGRILRYQIFRQVAKEFGAERIAVAHNCNDRAETMLFHLFRGSGVKGLCGIPAVREQIIRPLLCLERKEIEHYLAQREIPFCTDCTNGEDNYTRNRIRHHILPCAEQEVSEGVVGHLCRTADMLSELEDYLEQQTQEARKDCVSVRGAAQKPGEEAGPEKYAVDIERFGRLHVAIRKRVLYGLLRELAPGGRDISAGHVDDVLALFEKKGNPQICLPFGIEAEKRYDKVFLSLRQPEPECRQLFWKVPLPAEEAPQPVCFDLGDGRTAEISVFYIKKWQKVPGNDCAKWFDCDKIKESPVFRYRQAGDFLSLSDGRGGMIHKSLKAYMITEKIPREDRGKIPVLAEGNHVLWLTGYRISEYYKVNGNTKRVLQVKLIGNCAGRGTEEKDGGAY